MFDKIEKAFDPVTSSVYDYFQDPGIGFYIPLYQREYSWDGDNIDQLLDDLVKGVDNLLESPDREIRFLGTIIAVHIGAKQVHPLDRKALPASIQNIIDGQQRLSTISLFSTLLYKYVDKFEKSLKGEEGQEKLVEQLEEACQEWKDYLQSLFALKIKRGEPQLKPKIVRGNKDQWTLINGIENYKSEVSSYLAQFIDAVVEDNPKKYPTTKGEHKVYRNLKKIDFWLRKTIISAHVNEDNEFATAWQILRKVPQEHVWIYERPELVELVKDRKLRVNKKTLNYQACALVQLFTVAHYLLGRCCFTIIQPTDEDWAFDMFQSLNATGTPLTAIETFKPMVVNTTNREEGEPDFHESKTQKNFTKVDKLFETSASGGAVKKKNLSNEFLTSFALASKGTKLATHFSKQRKFLNDNYKNIEDYETKERFVNFLGNYAEFYRKVWITYKGDGNMPYPEIAHDQNGELASVLILFLADSNHKMAITILASFYSDIIDGEEGAISTFVEVCMLTAAFYTLWRSSGSNAGLDNVYRSFFKNHFDRTDFLPKDDEGNEIKLQGQWQKGARIRVGDLRKHMQQALKEKREIDSKESWLKKAKSYLGHDTSRSVSRLALFISAQDTQPDAAYLGLMKPTRPGVIKYLTVERWMSKDLKTVEHVAPRKPEEGEEKLWGPELYADDSKLFEKIGNLTLLPAAVNTSASNKGWIEKYIYYQHLVEKDEAKLKELGNKAKKNGVDLGDSTLLLLRNSSYSDHIKPIVAVGDEGKWSAELIEDRSERILSILWDRIENWVWKNEEKSK